MSTTTDTHAVSNQAEPLENYNTFEADPVLVEALSREGGDWARDRASEAGGLAGSARAIRWGAEANENPPTLRTHDRFGNRIDEVEFHPAWHELLSRGVALGMHALPWREPAAGRARCPRRDVHRLAGRGRRRLPAFDDLLGDPGAAHSSPSSPPSGSRAFSRSPTTAS